MPEPCEGLVIEALAGGLQNPSGTIAANCHHDAFGEVAREADSTTTGIEPPGCRACSGCLAGNNGHDTGLTGPTNADGGAGFKAHGPQHGPIVSIEPLFEDYATFAGSQFAQ